MATAEWHGHSQGGRVAVDSSFHIAASHVNDFRNAVSLCGTFISAALRHAWLLRRRISNRPKTAIFIAPQCINRR